MAVLDLERLLAPISEDTPCGEDLGYDASYVALETSARGKPERQQGETFTAAEPPDWREVQRAALELLQRTADIRLVVHLAHALLRTVGFPGLADALSLMHGLLDQRWDCVYPQIEEDDDPTMRVNAVAAIAHVPQQGDEVALLRGVPLAPLVEVHAGRFNLRDWQIASGELIPLAGAPAPATLADIEAAFLETPLEELQATTEAVRRSIAMTVAIEAVVTERVGAAQAPDLSALAQVLREAEHVLSEQLARRGTGLPLATTSVAGPGPAGDGNGAAPRVAVSGEITSREEIARMLDRACEYFHRYEPSSPVPLLLERAKRLMSKDFVEILRDLAPDGIAQFEVVSGINRENGA
jgi:type VI secretion system protein ImpA